MATRRQQWLSLCNGLVGGLPYSHYVMRSFPLCRVRVLHPAQYDLPLTRPPAAIVRDHQKKRKRKKKRYHGCLAHAAIGMFFPVASLPTTDDANIQENVLQRRCQPTPTAMHVLGGEGGRETHPTASVEKLHTEPQKLITLENGKQNPVNNLTS